MPAIDRCKPSQDLGEENRSAGRPEAGVSWYFEDDWWVDLSGATKGERGRNHRGTWAFLKEVDFVLVLAEVIRGMSWVPSEVFKRSLCPYRRMVVGILGVVLEEGRPPKRLLE